MIKYILLVLFALFSKIYAQTDSTQIKPKIQAKWKANLSLTGQFNRGNINRDLFSTNASVIWQRNHFELISSSLFQYGELNGKVNEREFNLVLDAHLFHEKRFYVFLLCSPEISRLRGIQLREYAVIGPAWNIIRTPAHKLSLSNGIMYENTAFVTGRIITLWRNSFRIKGVHSLFKDKVIIKYVFFHQAGLNKTANNRMSANLNFSLGITKILSATFAYNYIYESIVPEKRKHTDQQFLIGLSLKLSRN